MTTDADWEKHQNFINARNHHGETALLVGVKAGSFDCVKLLIEHGASLLIPDNAGNLPLHAVNELSESKPMRQLILVNTLAQAISVGDNELCSRVLNYPDVDVNASIIWPFPEGRKPQVLTQQIEA